MKVEGYVPEEDQDDEEKKDDPTPTRLTYLGKEDETEEQMGHPESAPAMAPLLPSPEPAIAAGGLGTSGPGRRGKCMAWNCEEPDMDLYLEDGKFCGGCLWRLSLLGPRPPPHYKCDGCRKVIPEAEASWTQDADMNAQVWCDVCGPGEEQGSDGPQPPRIPGEEEAQPGSPGRISTDSEPRSGYDSDGHFISEEARQDYQDERVRNDLGLFQLMKDLDESEPRGDESIRT